MISKALLLFPLMATISACTSLNVHKLTDSSPYEAREGIAYYLPLKQLQIDLQFRLNGCRSAAGRAQLSYSTAAKVAESQIPDHSERYTIAYRELAAITKTTDLSVVVSEQGLLVSVNATVTDQTGPILANLASAGFAIARGTALKAIGVLGIEVVPAADPCLGFKSKLDAVETLATVLKAAEIKDEERTSASEDRDKAASGLKLAEIKLKESTDAKDPAGIADGKIDVAKKQASFAVMQAKLTALGPLQTKLAANALERAQTAITVNRKILWTPVFESGSAITSQKIFATTEAFQALGFELADANLAAKQFQAEIALEPVGKPAVLKDVLLPPKAGIVYRQPAHMLLKVCPGTCDLTSNGQALAPGVVLGDQFAYAAVHAFPQFGAKASLPLSNGLFEDNGLKITFGESGQPKTVSFNSKSAAERASASAKEIGDGYLGFIKGRQTDQLDFRKALRADEEGQISLDTKRRDAQMDTLDDRLETLKKYQALENARSGTSTRDQLLEDSLATRKRQLQLQIEIKEQENKLKALGVTSN